jgi:hypothetical protein
VSLDPGALIMVHLINPTEKFWGVLERLEPVGVTFRGISVDVFEEWMIEIARGERPTLGLATMYVPLFRIERIFLDEQVGEVESYRQRFERRTGRTIASVLGLDDDDLAAGPPS